MGGCTVGPNADLLCAMRREAHLQSGQIIGLIAFGQNENSRYLFVEVVQRTSKTETPPTVTIDGRALANGTLVCRVARPCTTTISVSDALLMRLIAGTVLIVETSQKDIVIGFPLKDFSRARRELL
jgi:hypothetical protein